MTGCTTASDGETVIMSEAPTDLPNIDVTYPEMARELSTGSVQVFPLDDAPVYGAAPEWQRNSAEYGVPASGESNVVVYPFEDDGAQGMGFAPRITPPTNAGFVSPFTRDGGLDSGAYPMPEQYNDAPQTWNESAPTGYGAAKIYFKHGSSALDGTAREVLGAVAQDNQMGGTLQVEGHASERVETSDPVAKRIINLKISMDRAYQVSRELIKKGVPATAIETRAYGDTRPAFSAPGIDGEAASRRVEIHTAATAYPAY